MNKYAIHYSGYVYVEAEDETEAQQKFYDDEDIIYDECGVTKINEVDEFVISI